MLVTLSGDLLASLHRVINDIRSLLSMSIVTNPLFLTFNVVVL